MRDEYSIVVGDYGSQTQSVLIIELAEVKLVKLVSVITDFTEYTDDTHNKGLKVRVFNRSEVL